MTPMGQLVYFIQFLKAGNLFHPWVSQWPLKYESPNAPKVRDILGTILLPVLAGHRRAFIDAPEKEFEQWQQIHLQYSYQPLLNEPWILDIDSTVKILENIDPKHKRNWLQR